MKKKLGLSGRILIGMIAGVVAGLILRELAPGAFRDQLMLGGVLHVGGTVFMNAFRMIVGPVVFCSLTLGVVGMNSPLAVGRIGLKAVGIYIFTTACAVLLSIGIALLVGPGRGASIAIPATIGDAEAVAANGGWSSVLISIVPSNIAEAFVRSNMLQIIFISILSGIALIMIGERGKIVRNVLEAWNALNIKIIEIVMLFAPYGVFCLLATAFARHGVDALGPLMKYLACAIGGMALLMILVYGALLRFAVRLKVFRFFRKFNPVMALAFSSSSSNATLPFNIEVTSLRIGVPDKIASLVLSLGATVNMDGTAIMLGTASLFIAQFYGVDLTLAQLGTIALVTIFASVGTAGMPSAGVIMLAMVLQSVNLPLEGIALIIGVDRLVDMFRTTVNVTGDAVCACVVAESEGVFDHRTFDTDQ